MRSGIAHQARPATALLLMSVLPPWIAGPGWAQCQYEVTTIIQGPDCFGTPTPINPGGLSDTTQIAGYIQQCFSGSEAFSWTQAGGVEVLDRPPGFASARGLATNDHGDVVGWMAPANPSLQHAALWQNGTVTDLGIPPGGNWSEAAAVNDQGTIVGTWGNSVAGPVLPFLWQDGALLDLGPDLPIRKARGEDINDHGQVTGLMGPSFADDHNAYIWDDGVVTSLPVIPGGFTSRGIAINERGQVAGYGWVRNDEGLEVRHAFFWDGIDMFDLGTLPGHTESLARDVSDVGQVIGYAIDQGNTAFIWQDGAMTDMNELIPDNSGVQLRSAQAINLAGQILADGNFSGDAVVVLLTPLNRPASDIDGDCDTDVSDLIFLILDWGRPDSPADLNDDGTVDLEDLTFLVMNWS